MGSEDQMEKDDLIKSQSLKIGELENQLEQIKDALRATNKTLAMKEKQNEIENNAKKQSVDVDLEFQIDLDKDKIILDLKTSNAELNSRLKSLEEKYNNQVEVSTTLQVELQSSSEETDSLIKEMETLNLMFAELEKHLHSDETKLINDGENIKITRDGKDIKVAEVLQAAKSTEASTSLLQQSCCNEVVTKHGSKMVPSVSKTFLKLKNLILEKNTLVEQMTKIKQINKTLCSEVNLHEEKLCGITDELNNTWFYVSKIKEQHKKLHNSEQILRAELAEKRQILNSIRTELEESRSSWNLVKQKNEESEKQWLQLKADFAERKRILISSSESGFSEIGEEEKDIDSNSVKAPLNLVEDSTNPTEKIEDPIFHEIDQESDSEEIPDPFSDEEEDDIPEIKQDFMLPMLVNADQLIDITKEKDLMDQENEKNIGSITIFVPSMSYLAQVPSSMQPDLFSSEKEITELYSEPSRERVDAEILNDVDDNVRDLIHRLSSSTARGAFLANRLSDIHRRIANGASLTDHNDWDNNDDQGTETDIEPRETEHDDELTVSSPEIESEIADDIITTSDVPTTSTPFEELGFDDSRPASTDSMVQAIDEAIHILDPVSMGQIPSAPPQPTYSLLPTSIGITVRPNFNQNIDYDSEDDNNDEIEASEQTQSSSDSSTAVTRFLIKHLPKQLTQLRNEKHKLEDKVHDFEQIVSEQRMQMAEHERRVELERSKTKKLEERQKQAEEQQQQQNPNIPLVYKVPVTVEQDNTVISWAVETNYELQGFWMIFAWPGDDDSDGVVLPEVLKTVMPGESGITTTLEMQCDFRGRYTLHIQGGDTNHTPQVTVTLSPVISSEQLEHKKE